MTVTRYVTHQRHHVTSEAPRPRQARSHDHHIQSLVTFASVRALLESVSRYGRITVALHRLRGFNLPSRDRRLRAAFLLMYQPPYHFFERLRHITPEPYSDLQKLFDKIKADRAAEANARKLTDQD